MSWRVVTGRQFLEEFDGDADEGVAIDPETFYLFDEMSGELHRRPERRDRLRSYLSNGANAVVPRDPWHEHTAGCVVSCSLLWTRGGARAAHVAAVLVFWFGMLVALLAYGELWLADNKLWAGAATAALGAIGGYWYAKKH